ncbi:hypothetical protein B0T25DRAFT_47420 [Lasiosphaeria hispida]|uniref:Uncharacterized protein n=1 Tax=Lasiosphaeria hispida TaxID=260671 RepID=A0AAJ0HVZ4_9PEZI|nr:hypothetical protein B0T25DRAFT_47420 [Lasiosphaeria hispida]
MDYTPAAQVATSTVLKNPTQDTISGWTCNPNRGESRRAGVGKAEPRDHSRQASQLGTDWTLIWSPASLEMPERSICSVQTRPWCIRMPSDQSRSVPHLLGIQHLSLGVRPRSGYFPHRSALSVSPESSGCAWDPRPEIAWGIFDALEKPRATIRAVAARRVPPLFSLLSCPPRTARGNGYWEGLEGCQEGSELMRIKPITYFILKY